MRMKRILVCDDDDRQYANLASLLGKMGYQVLRSRAPDQVLSDLLSSQPIHLLILDLGYQNSRTLEREYSGHSCLPEVVEHFPSLKIIVYSDILVRASSFEGADEIFLELERIPQIAAFLGPVDSPRRIGFEINRALNSPTWFKESHEWLIHISDVQFGGAGLATDPTELLDKVWDCVDVFVSSNEEPAANYPFAALVTGDLSQRGRPEEFEQARLFLEGLGHRIGINRPEMDGIIRRPAVLTIPGNHDINWDISRARNLTGASGGRVVFKKGTKFSRPELDFLRRYSWYPYCEMENAVFGDRLGQWAWDPGYQVVSAMAEARLLFACVNSSRWCVDHNSQSGAVPEKIWRAIAKELDLIDPERQAARLLLVHHTLDHRSNLADRLVLDRDDNPERMVDLLCKICGFCAVFTGHIHKLAASSIDTGSSERGLVHVGAGTAGSEDLESYRSPGFNLLRIKAVSAKTDRFQSLSVFPFHWDGNRFCSYAAFGHGSSVFRDFDLQYC